MEGPTALAAQPTLAPPASLADDPQSLHQQLVMTDMAQPTPDSAAHTPARATVRQTYNSNGNMAWPETPAPVYDHGTLSNVRGAMSQDTASLNDPPTRGVPDPETATSPGSRAEVSLPDHEESSSQANPLLTESDQPSAIEEQQREGTLPEHDAYAAIRFVDCHVLVRTPNFVIMRDQGFKRRWQRQKKDDVRRMKARQALENYAREPSHQSEDGRNRDPSSRSGDGELEGRPARGLLSNYSEHDGPVVYAPSDDEAFEEYEAERLRRRNRKNNSSTSNSIAPADLHLFGPGFLDAGEQLAADTYVAADGTVRDSREWGSIAVHPRVPEDIMKISRDHLIFHYNASNGRWLLNVVGNGAFVNDHHYPKGTEDIELQHDDEILIATVNMRFALPQYDPSDDDETSGEAVLESVEAASDLSTSPVRRLSNAFGTDDSDEDEDEGEEEEEDDDDEEEEEDDDEDDEEEQEEATLDAEVVAARKPLQKLKLKNPKKPAATKQPSKGKGKGKASKKKARNEGKSIKKAKKDAGKELPKKAEKSKKPKASAPETEPGVKTEAEKGIEASAMEEALQAKPSQASPPAVPVNLDPGSVLAGLEPEQMPEKRKGPGRPPKNGVLSKRDESGVKRKRKEYERKGLEPPELQVLLNEVRKEQREKDAANKAIARGDPAPDVPMPSIEADERGDGDGGLRSVARDSQIRDGESSLLGEGRLSSPKLAQRIKSPSPIKPESAFTEEELKKPNMTYVFIIDDILKNIEGGQADLQTIYDKIQKRWPFYKYRVTSLGWQSSVRHNLLSCDRFKEAGKSGKGKMWTINEDHPIDNKKRKPTPPPRPPPVNGHMSNNMQYQYGQNGYPQYGQQQYNPQGPYASPYGGGAMQANGQYRSPNSSGQHAMPSQRPQNPFGNIVNDILAFRGQWILPLEKSDKTEFSRREDLFNRLTNYFSTMYHGKGNQAESSATLDADIKTDEEPFLSLKAIFERHNDIFNKGASGSGAPAAAPNGGQGGNLGANGSTNTASMPQPSHAHPQPTPSSSTNGQYPGPPPQNGAYNRPPAVSTASGTFNGTGATPTPTMAPSVQAHGSVQQQIGNAVANQAPRPSVQQQTSSQAPVPPMNAQSSMSGAPVEGAARPPGQGAGQPASNMASQAPAPSLSTTSVPPQPPVAPQQNAQDSGQGSNAKPVDLTAPAVQLPAQPPTFQTTNESGAGYGTPKAPTPEALSRPASAGIGAKRTADGEASAVQADHDAKRQRTS